jgi:hypothetical protein
VHESRWRAFIASDAIRVLLVPLPIQVSQAWFGGRSIRFSCLKASVIWDAQNLSIFVIVNIIFNSFFCKQQKILSICCCLVTKMQGKIMT